MAIFITPSEDINQLLDLKYATIGDEVELMEINGTLQLVIPSALPTPPPYSCRALVNTRGVTDLSGAWAGCTSITDFPLLEWDSCTNFYGAWQGCTSLVTFPAHAFDNSTSSNYEGAWTSCALNETSVDNILVSIDSSGVTNGTLSIEEGTSSPPSSTGLAAKLSLQARGWTVTTN